VPKERFQDLREALGRAVVIWWPEFVRGAVNHLARDAWILDYRVAEGKAAPLLFCPILLLG